MKIVWPTRSRTGSQFVLNMTSSLFKKEDLYPQCRINGYRKDSYYPEQKKKNFSIKNGIEYIVENNIQSMKYEDPGKDDFILEVMERYPQAVFVCSYRPIEKVINSHFNIKKWGHDESDVIYQFSSSLALYKKIDQQGKLVMIDIEAKDKFDKSKFLSALGGEANSRFESIIDQWAPVNDLKYQIEKSEKYNEKKIQLPPRIESLREIHPWIPELEKEYLDLCKSTTQY